MMALALAGPVLVATPALAEQVSIRSLVYAGSGCAPRVGLIGRLGGFDRNGFPQKLSLAFANYNARQGPGILLSERRRNCNLVLSLNLPGGWQYAIKSVRYQGFASLPPSVSALQQSAYEYPFVSGVATLESTLRGSFVARFQRDDSLLPREWVWSPCNRAMPLNLRTQIVLSGPRIRPANLRASTHNYGLIWRRCGR
jgi:hypothetical protein